MKRRKARSKPRWRRSGRTCSSSNAIGRHDHFFELGGHSLLAVSLIERMRQAGLSADVRVLFNQPSLAALAAAVGSGREIVVPANRIAAGLHAHHARRC